MDYKLFPRLLKGIGILFLLPPSTWVRVLVSWILKTYFECSKRVEFFPVPFGYW